MKIISAATIRQCFNDVAKSTNSAANPVKPSFTIKKRMNITKRETPSTSHMTITPQSKTSITGADILAEQNKTAIVNNRMKLVERKITTNPYHKLFENCTPQKARQAEELFFRETGLKLHCPTTWELNYNKNSLIGGFDNGLENLVEWQKNGMLKDLQDKGIKHIVIGHGHGSLIDGTWRLVETGENVTSYVARTIPKGERAIVMCCETSGAVPNKIGIGHMVDSGLWHPTNPAKVVESGKNEIIGHFFNPYEATGGVTLY